MSKKTEHCDILIIGSGLAGLAASFFATNKGKTIIQTGNTSSLQFHSGFFDIMAVHPVQTNQVWENPWEGIDKLRQDNSNHPYAFLTKEQLLKAFGKWFEFLSQLNIHYHYLKDQNIPAITTIGTQKMTHAVPKCIWTGISAMMQHKKALLVDFEGLKGFSGKQIKETLSQAWPELETIRISFPETSGELHAAHLANALESESTQKLLVNTILARAQTFDYIGFPSILGGHHHLTVCENIEKMIGKPVFEIPTLPPSMPGIRLRNALTYGLTQKGVQLCQKTVNQVEPDGKYGFIAHMGDNKIFAKKIILAAGRFMGKGLIANRKTIEEPLFNLPLHQPESRREWHQKHFFSSAGHEIHQAGVRVDQSFRPVGNDNRVINENLYAIGSILSHNDWMRHKCGSGVAIGSAFGAISHIDSL